MKPTLAALALLAKEVADLPDDRPQLLKAMTFEAPATHLYNRFLFEFARRYRPERVLELGTDRGRSAAHFALGHEGSQVLTLDVDMACTVNARNLLLPNLTAVMADSLSYPGTDHILSHVTWDVLFIDSLHERDHARAEYELYWPLVAEGGIIFFDDISLDPGMLALWESIEAEKVDLGPLHWSGFGAVLRGNVPPRRLSPLTPPGPQQGATP